MISCDYNSLNRGVQVLLYILVYVNLWRGDKECGHVVEKMIVAWELFCELSFFRSKRPCVIGTGYKIEKDLEHLK